MIKLCKTRNTFVRQIFAAFASSVLSLGVTALSVTNSYAFADEPNRTAILSGNFQASGGQATYSLPISVSPGRAGHQPTLSLEYRSDAPNGYLGMGWSIGGLSSITRCGKNLATDGRWGGVNQDANDRYCLDGRRLIAVSGRDGENLTEYRLEENGYSKIVSFADTNGVTHFKIWKKDGSVYEYGTEASSQFKLPNNSKVYSWSISKIIDIGSNAISFTYSNSNSEHRISEIQYVGGKVSFEYDTTRADKTSRYVLGQLLFRNHRLSKISTFDSSANEIGSYSLHFNSSQYTSRSLLKSVEYCASGSCATKVAFDWSGRKNTELGGAQNTGFVSPRFFDADRNGILEMHGYTNYERTYRGLSGASHTNIKSFNLGGTVNAPVDEIDKCEVPYASTYFANENGHFSQFCQFSSCPSGTSCDIASKGKNSGDVNGDGKETLFTGRLAIDINSDGIDDKHNFDDPSGGYKYQITGRGEQSLSVPSGKKHAGFADINNDGYLDAIFKSSSGSSHLSVYLFNGYSYISPTNITVSVASDKNALFSDLNNDGYPELIYEGKVYKNNFGTVQSGTILLTLRSDIASFRDINGDGWADLISKPESLTSRKNASPLRLSRIKSPGSRSMIGNSALPIRLLLTPVCIHRSDTITIR